MIYLDNAATTYPKPPEVYRAASEAASRFFANPGRGSYSAAADSENIVYSARSSLADFFGASTPENIVFTQNCTASINYVLKGCLHPGDHVIISNLEHNAVVRPLYALEKRGVSVTRVNALSSDSEQTVRAFRQAVRRDTRMIFCTHASNVLGVTLPVRRIGEICRSYGIIFGIDAAQSAGTLPLRLDDTGADFICIPAHKGLYGTMGLGGLISGGRVLPESLMEGGTGSLSSERAQPDYLPDRLESGTLNVPGIYALAQGLEVVRRIGCERIYEHELKLMQQLYEGLRNMPGISLYTGAPKAGEHAPLLSFNVGDMTSGEAGERLAERGIAVRSGFHCAYDAHMAAGTQKRGTVRVCPSMYTTERDIDSLLREVRALV